MSLSQCARSLAHGLVPTRTLHHYRLLFFRGFGEASHLDGEAMVPCCNETCSDLMRVLQNALEEGKVKVDVAEHDVVHVLAAHHVMHIDHTKT